MDLREPPRAATPPPIDRTARALGWACLAAVLLVGALVLWHAPGSPSTAPSAALSREVAAKLKAAGALDEAADLYAAALADPAQPAEERAKIAYSLGQGYLEVGRYERALRWLYEAESLGAGPLAGAVSAKIVESLERLGRHHAAQTALTSGTRLDGATSTAAQHAADDPVVADVAGTPVHRSEVLATLDDLPPEAARQLASDEKRGELLKHYVADELLYRKAQKLSLDDDPAVRRQLAQLSKQVVIAKLLEREVMSRVAVDESDLANFFAAHRDHYAAPAQPGAKPGAQPAAPPTLDQVRREVERDYRMSKAQGLYASMVESELAADGVKLFPERMQDAKP